MVCFYLMNIVSCTSKQVSLFALAAGSLIAKYVDHKFSCVDHYVLVLFASFQAPLCFFQSYLVLS